MAGTPLTELTRPLGQERTAPRGRPWGRWLVLGASATVGTACGALLLITVLHRNPEGGEPIATAPIETRIAAVSPPEPTAPAQATQTRLQSSARQLETESGVTVVRPGSDVPGSIIITIPDAAGVTKLAPSPDPRLTERSRYGMLPKTGADGATPLQVYARPLGIQTLAKPAGRVALLVGGLGISQSGTSDAIAKLPGAVSLAFAPYGQELERTVQRARSEGHEVLLQVPMEPFDYPDNDPGPHTLLTGPKAAENLDRLHWALSRFTGYVGVVNFLGGRLTADEQALSPVLREISGRGLMVVDDGSSSRSLLAISAQKAQIPALKVDRVIDTLQRADAIDKELANLEGLARDRGIVVAAASALPVSIERIARWARTLEAKGIVIVPISAAGSFRNPSTTGSLR